ncbi:MAG: scpB [Chthoniobacteraceae bacterium]|nr:scpB [Chthoniobacteraceae bacterium]
MPTPKSAGKKRASHGNAGANAARAVVQWLFVSGKSVTLEGIREKLRDLFREEVKIEDRAVASLSQVELVTALLQANAHLEPVGLQLRIVNGVVSLMTDEVRNTRLAEYFRQQTEQSGNPDLTTGALEVLACIAFKQPVSQSEIDKVFESDKRGFVVRLRDLKLVEEFPGPGGRLHFATTAAFLKRFNLQSLDELHGAAAVAAPSLSGLSQKDPVGGTPRMATCSL